MQVVHGGETIELAVAWYDSFGALVDTPDVTASIVRTFVNVVAGPFSLSNDIHHVGTGQYTLSHLMDDFLVPGNYTVRWQATIEGDLQEFTETFALSEPEVLPSDLVDPPKLYGVMKESHLYDFMGVGLTDTIFLVGHGDGIGINSPHQVINMRETINAIGGDARCPLLRGLLEAYNCGARDIYLVASAPMSEYIPYDPNDLSDRFLPRELWGGDNFYERYKARLEVTYEKLLEWENIELLVPLEAPFYNTGGVNFFDDMVWNCYDRFKLTGFPSIGLMGTQLGAWSPGDLTAMKETEPVSGVSSFSRDDFMAYITETRGSDTAVEVTENIPYKFGMIIFGEGSFMMPQFPMVYSGSPVACVAGMLAGNPLNRGITYQSIPYMVSTVGKDLTQAQIKDLARHRINPLIRKAQGKRGTPFQCVIASDNLFMPTGTDYWSMVSMRLVAKVIQEVKVLGQSVLGSINYELFKRQVDELLKTLVTSNSIRGYDLNIYRRPANEDPYQTVFVTIGLNPYFGVREIFFQVEVGPNS